jgi:pimeloyl-ACP methyl ester carboxylesterase
MTAITSSVLQDGVRLSYNDIGDGPTLLFHQGFGLTRRVWEPLVNELVGSYRCVTFDPRGHGVSDAPDSGTTVERLAKDLGELAGNLDLNDVTLVGHSLGGAAALTAIANQKPGGRFSRLVLVGAAVPSYVRRDGQPFGAPQEHFEQLLHAIGNDLEGTVEQTLGVFFHQTDPKQARHILSETLAMRRDVATELFASLAEVDLAPRLADVHAPVLALWGAHDLMSDPRWVTWFRDRGLPNWDTQTLPNSGHGAMVDEPVELALRIHKFIDRH